MNGKPTVPRLRGETLLSGAAARVVGRSTIGGPLVVHPSGLRAERGPRDGEERRV